MAARVAAWSAEPLTRERIAARCDELLAQRARDENGLKQALRELRIEVFGTVAQRDLTGQADLHEVTGAMSDLAELAIQRSLALLGADLEALYGVPRNAAGDALALGVVGMGKLGGRELNVSSDIDLILSLIHI